jgi:hypothetical protein
MSFAQNEKVTPFYESNYFQIDALSLQYLNISSSNSLYKEKNANFAISRASILFHLNIDQYIIRPFISIDPFNNNSQGALSLGRLFSNGVEFGGTSLLSHQETSVGEKFSRTGSVSSDFLLGPYIAYYPLISDKSFIEIFSDVTYKYHQYRKIVSGIDTNISQEKGVSIALNFLYSLRLNDKLSFSPHVDLSYISTIDFGGMNTSRKGTMIAIYPVSLQILL